MGSRKTPIIGMLVPWHEENIGVIKDISCPLKGRRLDMLLNLIMKWNPIGRAKKSLEGGWWNASKAGRAVRPLNRSTFPFTPPGFCYPAWCFSLHWKAVLTAPLSASLTIFIPMSGNTTEIGIKKKQEKTIPVWQHLLSFCRLHITHRSLTLNLEWICVGKSVK